MVLWSTEPLTEIKVEVKCTLVQALRLCTGRTANRGSSGIVLLFLDHGTRRGWGFSVTPRPLFTPEKDPVPIVQEAGWTPGPVWTGAENLAFTGIRSPHRPALSQSLYRLRYPAHLTEIRTRNIWGGKGSRFRGRTTFMCRLSRNSTSLNLLEPQRPFSGLEWGSCTFTFTVHRGRISCCTSSVQVSNAQTCTSSSLRSVCYSLLLRCVTYSFIMLPLGYLPSLGISRPKLNRRLCHHQRCLHTAHYAILT